MLKTLTFAALHFSVAFSVTYVLTGSIGVSGGGRALVEPLINTVVVYFHEKAWNLYEKIKQSNKHSRFSCTGAADV